MSADPADLTWRDVAASQAGVISRAQWLACGMTADQLRQRLDRGAVRSVLRGVYVVFTGPIPPLARVWAAVVYGGDGAVVAGRSALWLYGLVGEAPGVVELAVAPPRHVTAQLWVRVVVHQRMDAEVHPTGRPPRLRLEPALLDVLDRAGRVDDVVGLLLRATQRGLTTPGRLAGALADRPRHRWRPLVMDVLADAVEGVQSALERRYLRDVERAHGLPPGERNHRERTPRGSTYRDVRYREWRTLVELDGQEAHRLDQAHRDRGRDNASVLQDDRTLRYGWTEVAGRPCDVAAQVVAVLRAAGWPGIPRRCGPACRLS